MPLYFESIKTFLWRFIRFLFMLLIDHSMRCSFSFKLPQSQLQPTYSVMPCYVSEVLYSHCLHKTFQLLAPLIFSLQYSDLFGIHRYGQVRINDFASAFIDLLPRQC